MISKTPQSLAEAGNSQPADSAPPHDSSASVQQWIEGFEDHYHDALETLRATEASIHSDRQTLKQFRFGLDRDLVDQLNPLMKRIAKPAANEQGLEPLVAMAESALATLDVFQQNQDADHSDGSLTELAALSILLSACRLRSVAIDGSENQLQRLLHCLLAAISIGEEAGSSRPIFHQWLSLELPLQISAELFALPLFQDEAKLSLRRFVNYTGSQLDADAWPKAEILSQFAPLAASWVRCLDIAEACGLELDPIFMTQIDWLGEQLVRMHGPKKRVLFADRELRSKKSFVEFMLRTSSDEQARELALAARLVKPAKTDGRLADVDVSGIEASCVSEWSKSAILKSDWKSGSPLAGIDFSCVDSVLEIAAKTSLLSGVCPVEVRDGGSQIDFGHDGFEVVCDMINDEIAYIELEIQRPTHKFYRQLLLSKQDRFLFFADAIHKDEAGEIDYRLRLPLAAGIDVIPENGTRELYLSQPGKGIQSLLLPLALPEWSSERCRGGFTIEDDHLCVEKTVAVGPQGGALYNPLFLDLDPKRSRLKRTWRSLTVAEGLEIIPAEVAAAFRVQVDEDQYVFYRALQSTGNRSFMGQNFAGDFCAAKFFRNGKINELIEIQ